MSDEKFTSENMKVKHVLMIAAVLLAMLVVPVVAEEAPTTPAEKTQAVGIGVTVPAAYEIDIPASNFNFGASNYITKEIGISITKLGPKDYINLTVVSAHDWNLIHVKGEQYGMIEYNMTDGTTEFQDNDCIVQGKEVGEFKKSITFNLIGTPSKAGDYKDTLTFTAEYWRIVSTFEELQEELLKGGNVILEGNIDLNNGGLTIE